MSTYQHERLAAETEEEREARIQHVSTYQHERVAAEIAEEREVRLQSDRQRHRDQQLVQSCLNSIPFELRCISFMHTVFHSKPRCHANIGYANMLYMFRKIS